MDIDRAIAIANRVVEAGASHAPVVRPTVPGSLLVIDGDGLNYSCAGFEDTSPAWAKEQLFTRIKNLRNACGAEDVLLHLTHPSSHKRYRYAIATIKPYQGQRKSHKPKNWPYLRALMEDLEYSISWSDREADDAIALTAYDHDGPVFIASEDKDMRMLPGFHLNMKDYEITHVPKYAWDVKDSKGKQFGAKWFYLQMLHGDSVDYIPGLERWVNPKGKPVLCGDKTAIKLLEYCPNDVTAHNTVVSAYQDYYGDQWADRWVEQAALLWLSRKHDAADWHPDNFHCEHIIAAHSRLKERINAAIEG